MDGLFLPAFFRIFFPKIIADPNDEFSHNHFELQNIILAQKLKILEGGLHWWPFCQFLSQNKVLQLKMIMRKIVIRFCNNIRYISNEKRKSDKKGQKWRLPSKIFNFELEQSSVGQNDLEKICHQVLQ